MDTGHPEPESGGRWFLSGDSFRVEVFGALEVFVVVVAQVGGAESVRAELRELLIFFLRGFETLHVH